LEKIIRRFASQKPIKKTIRQPKAQKFNAKINFPSKKLTFPNSYLKSPKLLKPKLKSPNFPKPDPNK